MKIAVLIKQVPGSESALPINDNYSWVEESSVTFVMNPPDNFALEEALLIKEDRGEGEVVVLSMGPHRVQKVIREGLAKGADRGIHIEEDESIETNEVWWERIGLSDDPFNSNGLDNITKNNYDNILVDNAGIIKAKKFRQGDINNGFVLGKNYMILGNLGTGKTSVIDYLRDFILDLDIVSFV